MTNARAPHTAAEPCASAAEALMHNWQSGNVMAADCPSRQVLQHLTSRWGTLILIALLTGTHRFSGLRRRIGGISDRMLAQTLQQLEFDGMVRRVAHGVVPPHVDYSLTPLGTEAAEHVMALSGWIETNLHRVLAAQAAKPNKAA